jgi:hypothetical protein
LSKKQKAPQESASVVAARERQILDLARVDEEENRRIKQMRTVTRGVRAFRAVRGAAGKPGASSGTSADGATAAPAGPAMTPVVDYSNWSGMY